MADLIATERSNIVAIADAVRNKTGTTEEMTLGEIATEIAAISGGGDDDWYIDDASYLFHNGARINSVEPLISKLKDVTDMSYMFYDCSALTTLDVSNFDTSKVTNMESMFYNCNSLTTLDVSNFDTSNVTSMYEMFCGCEALTTLDVSSFDTSNVTSMEQMFNACWALTTLDVSNFDTSKVTRMGRMFCNCNSLTTLDLSNFDTSKVTDMYYIFYGCWALSEIIGFSAVNKAGLSIYFPAGGWSTPNSLKRLTFRTDLADGVYSIRSAISIKYCSFERDGMVEMFNTLPDVSSLGLSASYTTITITGNPCVKDGTLTAEDEAIATSKGWTLVK